MFSKSDCNCKFQFFCQFLKETLVEDPRSPTTDFARTPIVVTQKPPSKLHNKNLDNARKQLVALTPAGKVLQQNHTPKLLESSPLKPKTDTTTIKRKSLIGVLETNLDFKETDLDEVIQKKLECVSLDEFNKSIGVYEEIDSDPRSPTADLPRTPLQTLKKVGEIDLITEETEDVPKDDELTVVKNFDKKLTNLIYEDQEADLVQKPAKTKENGCRTPLGVRNCNEQQLLPPTKVVSKLRVSDRPLKTHVISKIPVFKEKRGKSGALLQCENTPPRKMQQESTNSKGKKSQWDSDRTLVI